MLGCQLTRGELHVDREADLRLEFPPEVTLPVPGKAFEDTLKRVERGQ